MDSDTVKTSIYKKLLRKLKLQNIHDIDLLLQIYRKEKERNIN